ncbi:alpha/beta fold hydrolase [Frondihabitans australicus]|uniref:Acyl-CoA synthetase (AMP-forming)/AMP-acid ligase II n=1 Tax=Frondihabitans australicus TaxID=386892 RepID=A0A495IH64_9MICO|nr:alpha/beta fold hydrolase [Frondihabitans australicus]RKR75327.1 acyl-CoA synthetase (AMP-forming)/AMP-acid ligase II [Frondihabitans australicus]
MTSRLPAVALSARPAGLPPAGLPGLDPRWSRLVEAAGRTWHVLDNAEVLAEAGRAAVGTVLCVHGNPTWSYLWRSVVTAATDQALAGGEAWRVVAVDQLDMGFSERTGVARDLPMRVNDLADLTDELALTGPVVTFGHDWGGIVSLGWAVAHREQLAGVMLLNTAVHQPSSSAIPAPLRLALGRGVLGRATVSTPAFLETTLALAHPSLEPRVADAYRAPYRGAARRGGIGAFVADIPTGPGHPSEPERRRIAEAVRELDVPALLLWGPRDPIFSDRYLDDLLGRLPHADVHRFEGSGHLLADDVDVATPALTWLGDRVSGGVSSPIGEGIGAQDPDAARPNTSSPRLWSHLDDRRDSTETALVEMAPRGGDGPRVVTWRALARRVDRLAAGLSAVGVRRGDRVSLLIPPGADLTAVLYACLRIGAIVVVADAGLGVRGLTRAVRGSWPHHLIGEVPGLSAARALGWPGRRISARTLAPALQRALGVSHSLPELASLGAASRHRLPEPPSRDDLAAILFTSGSTGPAKGVAYRHAQLEAVRDALASQFRVGPDTGLVAGFAPFALLGPALGARSATPDMDITHPSTLTARAVADALRAVDATVVFLSPAAVANVVKTQGALTTDDHAALGRVQAFLSAGAPVSPHLLERISALMPQAESHTPYGMTECLIVADIALDGVREAALDSEARGAGGVCVGRPGPGVRIRISALDADGSATGSIAQEPAPGVVGEIVIGAPHLFDHYDRLRLTDRAARTVDGASAGERWHRTGDVGHVDASGRLWVEGRLPHVIVTAEGVVTPVGVELEAEAVPPILRAAAVGIGPRGAQVVAVVAETEPAATKVRLADAGLTATVRSAVGTSVAAVIVVPALPTDIRHDSKIDRSALSDWASKLLAGERVGRPA